jgi:hypothetical protein
VAVLPGNTNEQVHVVRLQLVRRQIDFECLFGLESFIESVAFCHQGTIVFRSRHQAGEAKHRTKQPEIPKAIIRIHQRT